MTDIRRVSDDFAVAPQISIGDLPAIAALGFRTLVCNRPDGESGDQPDWAEVSAAAQAAGLKTVWLPFQGPPPAAAVSGLEELFAAGDGPVFAYCRSGTRSITAWALASAASGRTTPDDIIVMARDAGYDLSGLKDALRSLAGLV